MRLIIKIIPGVHGMRRIGFFAAIVAILLALNWSKLGFAGASDAQNSYESSGMVKITPPATANVANLPAKLEDSSRPPLSLAEARIMEGRLSAFVVQNILDNREKISSKKREGTAQFSNIEDLKSRTSFLCGNAGCIFSSIPGKDIVGRELVAAFVRLESGVRNPELAKLGLRPEKISSRWVGKADLQVNLTFLPVK